MGTHANVSYRQTYGQNNFTFTQCGNREGQGRNRDNNQLDKRVIVERDRVMHEGITCYTCNENGHYMDKCTYVTETTSTQVGNILSQTKGILDKSWIILDSCSMHSVSNNKDLMLDLHDCTVKEGLMVATNRDGIGFNKIG